MSSSANQSTGTGYDPYGLKDRVAIVTGAGQGLGREFARAYARAGAIAVIAELNEKKAEAVAQEIIDEGGKALVVRTDVADPDSTQEMAQKVRSEYGRIDILVNNAAYFSGIKLKPFDQISLEEWELAMRVNVTGVFLCCQAVFPSMRDAGWGRIVNMSAGAVHAAPPNYLHYPTTKTAVIGLTRALARELGNTGITVNAIMPGMIVTEIPRETVPESVKQTIIDAQSIQRQQEPRDLVGTLLFLSSVTSDFVTGQSISVDGGKFFCL